MSASAANRPRRMPGSRELVVLAASGLSALLAAPPWTRAATARHEQPARVRFAHLMLEHGLSNNWVFAILKDDRGFLWFGTQDGLNRYDGRGFKVYRGDPHDESALAASVVRVLFEDSKKRLWIGHGWANTGFALYDRDLDRFARFLPRPDLAGRPAGNAVRAITEDARGRLWLGTDNGVARFDPETHAIRLFPLAAETRANVPHDTVMCLLFDREGRLWVGTRGGLLRLDVESGRYSTWGRSEETAGPGGGEVTDLHEGQDGSLWVAILGGGLHRLDLASGQHTRHVPDPRDPGSLCHARVRRLVPDENGGLYVGTENGGLCRLDVRSGRFTRFPVDVEDASALSSGSVWSMHFDDEGILWVGTYDGGVNVLSPHAQRFRLTRAQPGGLSDSHVSALLEDRRGNLWIGTDGGGLNRVDASTGAFTHYRHEPRDAATIGSNAVWALLEDRRGDIWVGGWDAGIARLDPETGRVRRFRSDPRDASSLASNDVWRILELRSGELLVATQAGADLLDRASGRFTHLAALFPELPPGEVYSAAEDSRGNLWLVGTTAVSYLDRATGRVTRHQADPRDLVSRGLGWTQAVKIDSAGNVWLGTERGLFCVRAGDGALKRYARADGLPSDTITGLEEDAAGSLWIATKRGLTRLGAAVQVPERPDLLNFDTHDGLQGLEWARNACLRRRNGEMLFGGSRGLNTFDPARIRRDPRAPPVVFTELRIMNASVRPGSPGSPLSRAISETSDLSLSHRDLMVTFEFAGLSYALPQKNEYAYRLEGLDRNWNALGTQRTVSFTSLPPGRYTLHVRGSNGDGVWNEQGARLRIRVRPPWWGSWWFRSLVIGAALAVAAAAAQRVSARRMRRELERLERQRAIEHDRARIARDIHDDLGAGLTQISLLSDLALEDRPEEARARIEAIAETAGELTHAMDEIVWAVNPTGDTLDSLWDYLSHFAQEYLDTAGIHCRVDSPEPVPPMLVPAEVRHNVFLAAKEALTNVVKHSGAGVVRLRLEPGDRRFEIEIRDDGGGLPGPSTAGAGGPAPGRGLRNIAERMAAVGGSCEIADGAPGTRVRLSVKLP